MTEYINIMVGCRKFCCSRGIRYCYDCDHFGGLSKTMDEVACNWKDETSSKSKNK